MQPFGCVVDGFFDNDSDKFLIGVNWLGVSVSCQGHLFFHRPAFVGWWCCFSTESLILAQDERWRRA